MAKPRANHPLQQDAAGSPDWQLGRCQADTQRGTRCTYTGRNDLCGLYLCTHHEKIARDSMYWYLREQPRLVSRLFWEAVIDPQLAAIPDPGRSVVYFVERDGFIKIGTTMNLWQRVRDIGKGGQMITGMTVGPVRLLGTMPGDHRHEGFLHRQFRTLRVDGEWFLPDTRLCEFIKRLPDVDHDLLNEVQIQHGLTEDDEDMTPSTISRTA